MEKHYIVEERIEDFRAHVKGVYKTLRGARRKASEYMSSRIQIREVPGYVVVWDSAKEV